ICSAYTSTGIGLEQYAVASGHILADRSRGQAHTVFVRLDFFGNTDLQLQSPNLDKRFYNRKSGANLRRRRPSTA
ncbi:hypothetical protein CQ12_25240, partial [Bradyrhizobium jicamae]